MTDQTDPTSGAPASADGPSLFVSHASADAARAGHLVSALESAGCQVWWDGMLTGGEAFQSSIETMLNRADAVIVLWSAAANDSHWVRDEATVGRDRGRLVPLSLDGSLPPLGFRQLHVIDLSGWNGHGDDPALAAVLAAIATVAGQAPRAPAARRVAGAAASGSGLATPGTIDRRWLLAGGAAAVAAAAGGGWWLLRPQADASGSIAVLPFRNLSGNPAQDYFAEGLSEELRTILSLNRQLLVSGAASAGGFREANADPRQIARALGVSSLLMGSVRPSGSTVRIAARLVDGASGLERWTEGFDRSLSDVLAVQAEIAAAVADSLISSLASDAAWQARRPGGSANAAAFDHYLKGQALYQASSGLADDQAALAAFDAALAADPGYGAAQAARARCLAVMANTETSSRAAQPLRTQALAAARRAISLAPDMAEGHAALGYLLMTQLDLAAARTPYQRSKELGLGNAPILAAYAEFAANTGDFAPARAAASRACELDPLNPAVFRSAGLVLADAGDYPAARSALQTALTLKPSLSIVHRILGDMALAEGNAALARSHYAREPSTISRLRGLAAADARLNGRAAGAAHMAEIIRRFGDGGLYQQAEVLAQWGERDQALALLERALGLRDAGLILARNAVLLRPLRDEPRFKAVLLAMGVTR